MPVVEAISASRCWGHRGPASSSNPSTLLATRSPSMSATTPNSKGYTGSKHRLRRECAVRGETATTNNANILGVIAKVSFLNPILYQNNLFCPPPPNENPRPSPAVLLLTWIIVFVILSQYERVKIHSFATHFRDNTWKDYYDVIGCNIHYRKARNGHFLILSVFSSASFNSFVFITPS